MGFDFSKLKKSGMTKRDKEIASRMGKSKSKMKGKDKEKELMMVDCGPSTKIMRKHNV